MAGFSNLYPNLPGMLANYKDGGLALRALPEDPTTKALLILGTSLDGPVMEPVAVDPQTVSKLFGAATSANGIPNGSTIVPAFEEAWLAGCRDIRVMRITGKEAEVAVLSPEVTANKLEIKEEQLGIIAGNDETTITLSKTPIVAGSVLSKARGAVIPSGVTVNDDTGVVVIAAGKCDAGAELSFDYSYKVKAAESTETLTVADEAGTLTLTATYDLADVASITRNGGAATVTSDKYTIDGKKIKFNAGAVDTDGIAVATGNEFDLTYTGFTGEVAQATENSDADGQWKAATSEQVFSLQEAPVAGSLHLYANDTEVLSSDAFTVDGAAKTVAIKKEKFKRGQILETSYNYAVDESYSPSIILKSPFGGAVYNETSIEVKDIEDSEGNVIGKTVVIYKPDSKKAQTAEPPMEFSSQDYPTLRQLMNAINAYTTNNVVRAETEYEDTLTSSLKMTSRVYLSGGEDGLNQTPQQIFEALSGKRNAEHQIVEQGAYQLLEDYMTDFVVVTGIYGDTKLAGKYQSFVYDLAMFCGRLSAMVSTTHGVISLTPLKKSGLKAVQDHAKNLAAYNNNLFMRDMAGNIMFDGDGKQIDIGSYVSVVAGPNPMLNLPSLGNVYVDGAALYAGRVSALSVSSAPTNKVVEAIRGFKYEFSKAQLNAIVGNRLITFKSKSERNNKTSYRIVDGVTCAQPGSDYARIVNIRVTKEGVDNIFDVSSPFLGEGHSPVQQNSLGSAIDKRLGVLRDAGVFQDYEFTIISNVGMSSVSEYAIELTIVPPGETRRITVNVGLQNSL